MPSPEALVKHCLLQLKQAGNASDAKQSRYYFKACDEVSFFGVKTPKVREIVKGHYQKIREEWSASDAIHFCELMLKRPEMEAKTAGLLLLARYQMSLDASLIDEVERWLAADLCNNWATTDGLCSLIIAPLVGRHPELLSRLKAWAARKNLWLRRAAIVTLVPLARRGINLDFAYEMAAQVVDQPEDLMHKATGWMLREAGKTDPGRLESYLLLHGPRIPRTTVRYAIEKFTDEKRRKLLKLTRQKKD